MALLCASHVWKLGRTLLSVIKKADENAVCCFGFFSFQSCVSGVYSVDAQSVSWLAWVVLEHVSWLEMLLCQSAPTLQGRCGSRPRKWFAPPNSRACRSYAATSAAARTMQPCPPATGAHALLACASRLGISVCFANPGTSEMQLVSAMDDSSLGIRPVLCLHENVATGAADGYGRMAQTTPALALLHLGPGLANGLANLHNARRARSPLLVLVGDMASWHVAADPVLNMDVVGVAATVSGTVVHFRSDSLNQPRSQQPGAAPRFSMQERKGVSGSRVTTLVIPHDASWGPASNIPAETAMGTAAAAVGMPGPANGCDIQGHPGTWDFIRSCAAAIRQEARTGGKVAIYLGGAALASEEAMTWAGRISVVTGATLMCEGAFARVERGSGLPSPSRLPYFPQEAQQALAAFSLLVTVDARLPVANFGYRDGPSQLVTHLKDAHVWELDDSMGLAGGQWVPQALHLLAQELGASAESVRPGVNCRGVFCTPNRPPLPPSGRLTAQSLCCVLAALQPEGTILVDESLTSGGAYWELSKGCPRFSHLTLTGGAIGIGPALSVGAALACPSRLVINLQADGSAMYSVQSLWTQAREQLNVITIICDNSSYSILKVECARQRLPPAGAATRALTSLSGPALDWVSLAQGMGVPAVRVTTVNELADVLASQISRCRVTHGPFVIQASLPA